MVREDGMRIPGWAVPVAISLAGVLVGWGVNAQRMTELDRRTDQQTQDTRQLSNEVADHETKIEVVKAQCGEILRRLDAIDKKLEEQGKVR